MFKEIELPFVPSVVVIMVVGVVLFSLFVFCSADSHSESFPTEAYYVQVD